MVLEKQRVYTRWHTDLLNKDTVVLAAADTFRAGPRICTNPRMDGVR